MLFSSGKRSEIIWKNKQKLRMWVVLLISGESQNSQPKQWPSRRKNRWQAITGTLCQIHRRHIGRLVDERSWTISRNVRRNNLQGFFLNLEKREYKCHKRSTQWMLMSGGIHKDPQGAWKRRKISWHRETSQLKKTRLFISVMFVAQTVTLEERRSWSVTSVKWK